MLFAYRDAAAASVIARRGPPKGRIEMCNATIPTMQGVLHNYIEDAVNERTAYAAVSVTTMGALVDSIIIGVLGFQ